MYNKLFTKILDSSIWLEPNPTRIVWITFLAAMDEDGFAQFSSVRNLANRAMVTVEEATTAVATLEGPDPESHNKKHEGRRIERVPGGWMVLNAEEHRKMVTRAIKREQTRDRVAKHRLLKKIGNAPVTPSEAVSDTEAHSTLRSSSVSTLSTSYSDRANGSDVLTKREAKRRAVASMAASALGSIPK